MAGAALGSRSLARIDLMCQLQKSKATAPMYWDTALVTHVL